MVQIFDAYPALSAALPHVALGAWPTPVRPLRHLGGNCALYAKDDGASGPLYGGNKVRKLEFLLADALERDAREVMTFGVAGSNHALATALYAEHLGLRSISILTPQRNARYVATNLLAQSTTNAELHHYASEEAARVGAHYQRLRHRRTGPVATIPGGGSSALGTIGFVSAAFELAAQIEAGHLPVPDRLYVALGTMGTAAGLLLGLRACGLPTELVPVRVVREDIGNEAGLRALFERTNARLCALDPSFPRVSYARVRIRHDQYGPRYAVFTPAGMAARRRAREREGLHLEGTYTGKCMAALLDDLDRGDLEGRVVLYWHTYNALDLGPRIAGAHYSRLPPDFHAYFERPVQPLDRD